MIKYVHGLINYAIKKDLIKEEDYSYCYNQLIYFFKLEHKDEFDKIIINSPEEAIFPLIDSLYERKIINDNSIQYKDHLLSKVMNIFADKPSVVIKKFNELSQQKGIKAATDWFYKYMKDLDYIKTTRISKNVFYTVESKYGEIEITINVSKPELDPETIAKRAKAEAISYPKCVLCPENEGFAGNITRDSRDTIRLIPVTLSDGQWYFQYSPYSYYNEHAIVLTKEHKPMSIEKQTFINLLNLVTIFDGYFFGSNTDLPIVGGSILSHNHYQGGSYTFPIERAKVIKSYNYNKLIVEVIDWPLSTIRLKGSKEDIVDFGDKILTKWLNYSNPKINIYNFTTARHNTVTPIARKKGNIYELDIVLRNNITNDEYPLGLYHPHPDVWPIKKENIGLIEVCGLAILPKRLIKELEECAKSLIDNTKPPKGFEDFVKKIPKPLTKDALATVYEYAGLTFVKGLEDCGVLDIDNLIKFTEEVLKECSATKKWDT